MSGKAWKIRPNEDADYFYLRAISLPEGHIRHAIAVTLAVHDNQDWAEDLRNGLELVELAHPYLQSASVTEHFRKVHYFECNIS